MAKAIILLPGIAGSSLYLAPYPEPGHDERVWFTKSLMWGGGNREALRNPQRELDPRISLPTSTVFGIFLVPGYTEVKAFFGNHPDFPYAILEKVTDYAPDPFAPTDRLLFDFPYDWRQDIRLTATELASFVANTVLDPSYDITQISLLAHSMGGLISREFLRQSQGAANVDLIKHLILVGTPNHGAPKAYTILKKGRGFLSPNYPMSELPPGLEVLMHRIPGIYQLLPSAEYFSERGPGPIVRVSGIDETSARGTYLAADASIFAGRIGGETEARNYYTLDTDYEESERNVTESLIEGSLQFHADLGRHTYLDGPDQETHVVCGVGSETIARVEYAEWKGPHWRGWLTTNTSGDGTVPRASASGLDGLASVTDFDRVEHVELIRRYEVLEHIASIIED